MRDQEASELRLPACWAPLLTAALMSMFMVLIITAALNLLSGNASPADFARSFLRVWPIAFVAVLGVLPLVRWLVGLLTQHPDSRR